MRYRSGTTMHSDFDRIVIVGAGRLGTAIAPALAGARFTVVGPLRREQFPSSAGRRDVLLLCVPDHAIAGVAASIAPGPLVGHCSGALTLDVLGAHAGFSMHPLLAVTTEHTDFRAAACAVAGRTDLALRVARTIAVALAMEPVHIPDEKRALYHAAASMASNYLVTVEDAAEQLARSTGIERRHLARLAQSALSSCIELGGREALTGPIVRRDEATVARQRVSVEHNAPHLVKLWESLAEATRLLARASGLAPR
jgi:predicted short-subunit dehydrogenase-like oxidoreductase (DUF2520 family)